MKKYIITNFIIGSICFVLGLLPYFYFKNKVDDYINKKTSIDLITAESLSKGCITYDGKIYYCPKQTIEKLNPFNFENR